MPKTVVADHTMVAAELQPVHLTQTAHCCSASNIMRMLEPMNMPFGMELRV